MSIVRERIGYHQAAVAVGGGILRARAGGAETSDVPYEGAGLPHDFEVGKQVRIPHVVPYELGGLVSDHKFHYNDEPYLKPHDFEVGGRVRVPHVVPYELGGLVSDQKIHYNDEPYLKPHDFEIGGRAPVWPPPKATPTDTFQYRTLDIFFSAGVHEAADYLTSNRSCNFDATGNCSLYRVRWAVGVNIPIRVDPIYTHIEGGRSAFHPSVSPPTDWGGGPGLPAPTGQRLAFMTGLYDADTLGDPRQVEIVNLDDDGVDSTHTTSPNMLHPHWYDEHHILLNHTVGGDLTTFSELTDDGTISDLTPSLAGYYSLDDPVTHPNPPACGASRGTGPLVAVMTKLTGREDSVYPRVGAIDGRAISEPFDLQLDPLLPQDSMDGVSSIVALAGCHHPAWSPAGDAIICTALDDAEEAQQINVDGYQHNLIFAFTPDCGRDPVVWTNGRRAFEPLPPEELSVAFPAFPSKEYMDGTGYKYTFVYKYAEWCASESLFVVTLFVKESTAPSTIIASRVMLHDAVSGTWWDLTTLAEEQDAVPRGTYHGVYQTCSACCQTSLGVDYVGDIEKYPPEGQA